MLFFEDFLCGFPYEVYPTPAKGKDGERYAGVVCPWEVGSHLDRSLIVIGIRGTNAHRFDFTDTAYLFQDGLKGLH